MTRFFHDIFLTFRHFPDFSPTAIKFPDISKFSGKVVTLLTFIKYTECQLFAVSSEGGGLLREVP